MTILCKHAEIMFILNYYNCDPITNTGAPEVVQSLRHTYIRTMLKSLLKNYKATNCKIRASSDYIDSKLLKL